METKICSKCGVEKQLFEFRKIYDKKHDKYYYRSSCHECELAYSQYYEKTKRVINDERRKQQKKWREENENKIREYRKNNKERIREKSKEYYEKNKDKLQSYSRDFYSEHKDYYKIKNKEYKSLNKGHISEYNKKYLQENHEAIMARRRIYIEENRDMLNSKRRVYNKSRIANDEIYRFKVQIRHLINHSMERRGYKKTSRTHKILGCDYNFFIDYLFRTYKDNYGVEYDGFEIVHIDHIIPLATAKTKDDVIRLCHYTNLQLLKEKDNIDKKDKLDWNLENKK